MKTPPWVRILALTLFSLTFGCPLIWLSAQPPPPERSLSEHLEELALHQELYAQMWPQRALYFQGRADEIRLAAESLK